jgi:hypothetical protein
MVGRPKLMALDRWISEQEGGEDEYIFDRMADGIKPKKLAELITAECGMNVSRGLLYAWRDFDKDGARLAKWDAAMKVRAEADLEDGGEILDTLAERKVVTSAEVSLATSRANWRKEMAKLANPEKYGDQQAKAVGNVAEMLLEALKVAGTARQLPKPEIPMIEAKVVDENEAA